MYTCILRACGAGHWWGPQGVHACIFHLCAGRGTTQAEGSLLCAYEPWRWHACLLLCLRYVFFICAYYICIYMKLRRLEEALFFSFVLRGSSVCVYVVFVYMYGHVCVCIYIWCVCLCVCVYIYIYTKASWNVCVTVSIVYFCVCACERAACAFRGMGQTKFSLHVSPRGSVHSNMNVYVIHTYKYTHTYMNV